ncbi:MAG: hypothetical protein ACLTSL_19550 [Odoribacter splanchnicus]
MKLIGLLLLLALGFAACRDKSKKSEVIYATNPNEMIVGSRDSAAVVTLVTMFMERMKAGHPDSALMLLRTAKPDCQPQGLNREEFVGAMKTLKQFPVADYTLEHIKFLNPNNNEVKCRIRTPNDTRINLYFKPVRYLGRWSLCMKGLGEHPTK